MRFEPHTRFDCGVWPKHKREPVFAQLKVHLPRMAVARPADPVPQDALAITGWTLSKELMALLEPDAVKLGYGRIEIVSVAVLEGLGATT